MKKLNSFVFFILFLSSTSFAATLYQTGSVYQLAQRHYKGIESLKSLKHHGDFGVGFLDQINGDVVAYDGRFFQLMPHDRVNELSLNHDVPFFLLTRFVPKYIVNIKSLNNLSQLKTILLTHIKNKQLVYAIRVSGSFEELKLRGLYKQHPPFASFTEVEKNQSVFTVKKTDGLIIGYYIPDYLRSLSGANFSLNFISLNHVHGGHVLDVNTNDAQIAFMPINKFEMRLPSAKHNFDKSKGGNKVP